MLKEASYEAGVKAALESYGLQRRMPFGPEHLGPERLSRMLQSEHESFASRRPAAKHRRNPLDRPTQWGQKAPLESGSFATQGYSGMGPYGGV